MRPIVLSIAGSDCSGGAGIQADLKAIEANGGYAATVVTAITAQNTRGVLGAHALPAELVREQLDAVFSDLQVAAVKSGMLAEESIIRVVAAALRDRPPPAYVLDPVMISKSGYSLLPDGCLGTLKLDLLPLATLVTPNVHEAEALTGTKIRNIDEARRAGRLLLQTGAGAVLVKGGHLSRGSATDVLVTPEGYTLHESPFIDTPNTHGTGCTYSAAIATCLARGLPLDRAVERSKAFITRAIRAGLPIGRGQGPTDPFFFLERDALAANAAAVEDEPRWP